MAHSTTILGQVLKLMARSHIEALDKVHGTGRPHRGLSRWSQVGVLVFAQLAGRHSLRDVAYSLASQANALAPLGSGSSKALDPGRGQRPAPCGAVSSALGDALCPLSGRGAEASLPLQESALFSG